MAVEIRMTQGYQALVDDSDAFVVEQFRWYPQKLARTVYAVRSVKRPSGTFTTESLHRLLTGWQTVDHINGDGLDNRRCNLREATFQQNQRNKRKSRGTSRYKGVCWHKPKGKWIAQIYVNHRCIHLGWHETEEAAALAYDTAARNLFGEFAAFNFPLPGENSALSRGSASTAS